MSTQKFKKSEGYRGYIFTRKINGSFIPHRVQNLVIKDFAKRKNFFFKLSLTEYAMEGSYVTLGALLKEVKKLEGVIFYSYEMLFDNLNFCKDILLKIVKNKKSVHFALEEIHIKNNIDIKNLLKIIQIKKNSMPLAEKNTLKKILNTKNKIMKQ
tara:strand:- start:2 stop:466 length:465 start_codon:yes stop_codon:yes gene_type:complete